MGVHIPRVLASLSRNQTLTLTKKIKKMCNLVVKKVMMKALPPKQPGDTDLLPSI